MWIVFYRPIEDEDLKKFTVIAVVDESMPSVIHQVTEQLNADYGSDWRERAIDSLYDLEMVIN